MFNKKGSGLRTLSLGWNTGFEWRPLLRLGLEIIRERRQLNICKLEIS
jgi:hypothetical protein